MPVHSFSDFCNIAGSVAIENTHGDVLQSVATGSADIQLPPGCSEITIQAKAATTGATLPPGEYNGQLLFITITTAAANAVTFASPAKSRVAGGSEVSLSGVHCHLFRWHKSAGLWYQVGR